MENSNTNENLTDKTKSFDEKNNKKKNSSMLIFIIVLVIVGTIAGVYFTKFKGKDTSSDKIETTSNNYLSYRLSGNALEDFDLYFLQLENENKNLIYSPLSVKYALAMLEEGANGETKEQISNIIGAYSAKKYTNSSNMSFANALFIKDSFKNSIKDNYISNLSSKYNADIVYDSFKTPNTLNSWVSNRTFKLINNLMDDISNEDFVLVNALAIDMEWVNKIQSEDKAYFIEYAHENYAKSIYDLKTTGYHELFFEGFNENARSVEMAAIANKYDIVNVLGEQTIRDNITQKYQDWLNSENYQWQSCNPGKDKDVQSFVDDYIKEINKGYKDIVSTTDFKFHSDDDVKVFAKDLKEYNGTTLQYIGIMPKNESLNKFIKEIKASNINTLISNLKSIELDSFKEGVITEVHGYIPMFKFDYEINLMDDLNKLGITNVFDSNKADLSNLSTSKAYINQAAHKANIEFSNDGIKAAATTTIGGAGGGGCGFDYKYDVPVEKIDLTFDKPYMFIIRDKDTGEVWFTGTVYEPEEQPNYYGQ